MTKAVDIFGVISSRVIQIIEKISDMKAVTDMEMFSYLTLKGLGSV